MKAKDAEKIAASYLQKQSLTLLAQNYRCRFGEIDLIMQENDTLVFIEVRLRTQEAFGGAAASITSSKQAKLLRTARHYLAEINDQPLCRFDVILFSGSNGQNIEWIRNAFEE